MAPCSGGVAEVKGVGGTRLTGRVLYCWAWAARRAFFSAKLLEARAEGRGGRVVGMEEGMEVGGRVVGSAEVEGEARGEKGEGVGDEVEMVGGGGAVERSVAF